MTDIMFTAHSLITYVKKVLCSARRIHSELRGSSSRPLLVSDHRVLRIVAVTHGPHTKVVIRTTALREGWQLRFVQSSKDALELIGRMPVDILVYDCESDNRDWRKLSEGCVEHGVCFQLVACRRVTVTTRATSFLCALYC